MVDYHIVTIAAAILGNCDRPRQCGPDIPMTMQDWSQRLNRFLEFNEHEILHDTGRVTHEIAKAFAESEFEKYRIVQDRMFESDFDHFLALEEQAERKND